MNDAHALAGDPYVAAFPENRPFWEAAEQGRLLLPHCASCGQFHWHPRPRCPYCRSDAVRWEQAGGEGVLHTYTVIRRPGACYVLAYVQVTEGPLLMTNIVDADPEHLHIGMVVRCGFRTTAEGRHAPVFRPRMNHHKGDDQ